jgi:hypothetical protein
VSKRLVFLRVIMTTTSKILGFSGALFLAGVLGGCASGASGSGSMGGMGGMGGGQMDMQAMCEMHKGMMAGKSTTEQQAMMNEHMKSMSPQMRTRMQAMLEKCKAS